jgi:outer membrane protein assembly factor BamB
MNALALALAFATVPPGLSSRLPPAPVALYRIAWQRPFVPARPLEVAPLEPGGVAVDPVSGLAVFGTRDGWLHAVRPDGKVAWELRAGSGFSAPPLIDGDTIYAGSDDGKLYAVALATGKARFSYDAKEELGTRPVLAGGLVFVASLQDTLFAIDARTGAWKWHHRREGKAGFSIRGAASPLVLGGTVFTAYSDGFVAALEAATGKVKWERQVAPAGDLLDVDSLEIEGTRLYATAYSGAVIAIEAATGTQVWNVRAPGASRLAVTGGLVVVVTTSTIQGLSPVNGTALWTTPLDGTPGAEPIFAGKWLLVPASQGGLHWVEIASGRTLRVFDPGTGVSAVPGVHGSRVYVLSNGGDLFALDLT